MANANSTTKQNPAAIAERAWSESPTSPATVPSTSHSGAFQPPFQQREQTGAGETYQSGTSMNRRTLMNMMVSTALVGATAVQIAALGNENAAIAGAKFEALLREYIAAGIEWAKLHRAAREVHPFSFGADRDEKNAVASAFMEANGTDQAGDRQSALFEQMEPLADTIKGALDLRSCILVAIWEALPSSAYHEGKLEFFSDYDGGAIRSVFDAAISLVGLRPLFDDIEERLAAEATTDPTDYSPGDTKALAKAEDPIFALIDNHKRIAAEYDRAVQTHDENDPALEPLLETLGEAETDAGIDLLNEVPTTVAGAVAILQYAADERAKGRHWPDGLLDDDQAAAVEAGKIRIGRPWEYFLHRNLVETLQAVTA